MLDAKSAYGVILPKEDVEFINLKIGDIVRADMGECGDLIGTITEIVGENMIIRKFGDSEDFEFKEEELTKISVYETNLKYS